MSAALADAPRVDAHLTKFSQAWVVALTGMAFLFNKPIVTLLTAISLAVSALVPAAGPFRLLYHHVVVPRRLLAPRIVEDDPAPHRFAQGVGAAFLSAASILLFFTKARSLGWALNLIVFVLAAINLTVGFCAGCFVYFHLGRWGLVPRVRYSGGFRWRGV